MKIRGNTARRVYRAAEPTDGKYAYPVYGIPKGSAIKKSGASAMPVYPITAAQIASGQYKLVDGNPIYVYEDTTVTDNREGGIVFPVYDYNGIITNASPVVTNPLSDSLVLCLNMNETTGNRIDTSGHGHNAIETGTVTYDTGIVSNSAKTPTQVSNYLTVPYHADFALGTAEWWASVWIYPVSIIGYPSYLGQGGWEIWFDESTKYFAITVGAGYKESAVTVSANAWYNIQFGYDDGSYFISVNGEIRVRQAIASITDTGLDTKIFGPFGTGAPNNTRIDRFYRWNKAWTATLGALDYNGGAPIEL